MNGAQALIESLLKEQVDHIFGYAGATICPIVDVLKEHPEICDEIERKVRIHYNLLPGEEEEQQETKTAEAALTADAPEEEEE